jgi:hypothetical protein
MIKFVVLSNMYNVNIGAATVTCSIINAEMAISKGLVTA